MDVTDDPESPDAAPLEGGPSSGGTTGFDLTPRTGPSPDAGKGRSNGRRWVAVGALVALLGALGFVLFHSPCLCRFSEFRDMLENESQSSAPPHCYYFIHYLVG